MDENDSFTQIRQGEFQPVDYSASTKCILQKTVVFLWTHNVWELIKTTNFSITLLHLDTQFRVNIRRLLRWKHDEIFRCKIVWVCILIIPAFSVGVKNGITEQAAFNCIRLRRRASVSHKNVIIFQYGTCVYSLMNLGFVDVCWGYKVPSNMVGRNITQHKLIECIPGHFRNIILTN